MRLVAPLEEMAGVAAAERYAAVTLLQLHGGILHTKAAAAAATFVHSRERLA